MQKLVLIENNRGAKPQAPHLGFLYSSRRDSFGTHRIHPVETPSVFAVLFEAAKAKSALCDSRVCLAKNAERFLRVTREVAGIHKGRQSLMHVFFGSFL